MSPADPPTLSRLTGAARFEAAMAVRPCARTAHFMAHHRVVPVTIEASSAVLPDKLSTGSETLSGQPVDDFCTAGADAHAQVVPRAVPAPAWHLGLVVPKRHARRAVTRTLVKRLIRAGMQRHLPHLVAGDWVLRLRAPIDRKQFPSARSEALADVLRAEIETLLVDAARRARRAALSPEPRPAAPANAAAPV